MTTDTRPIVLRSIKEGLSLVVQPGTIYAIPGSKAPGMTFGKWIQFERGQAVVKSNLYEQVWGTREKAIEALKQRRGCGSEFFVLDSFLTSPAAPGAASEAAAPKRKRSPRKPKSTTDQPPPAQDGTRPVTE